jgi:hypothetical protein
MPQWALADPAPSAAREGEEQILSEPRQQQFRE